MKIGVSSYCYSRLFGKNGFDIYKLIKTVKEIGFDGIEFSGVPGEEEASDVFKLYGDVKKLCADEGLEVINCCFGSDFLNGSGGDIDKEIAKVKHYVDLTEAIGSKCMRHDATGGPQRNVPPPRGFDDVVEKVAHGYREVTQYAEKKGIVTSVENHGYFVQDSVRVEKLINKVGSANFGALIDIGNFLCADENPSYAIGVLAPYAKHVHAKDFHVKSGMLRNPGEGFFKSRGGNYLRGAIVGHGNAPVDQCIAILKNQGYAGYISLEFEGLEDPILGTTLGKKYLEQLMD